jgi:hypothetical protein
MAVSPTSPTRIGTNTEFQVTNRDYARAFSTQFAQKLQSIVGLQTHTQYNTTKYLKVILRKLQSGN